MMGSGTNNFLSDCGAIFYITLRDFGATRRVGFALRFASDLARDLGDQAYSFMSIRVPSIAYSLGVEQATLQAGVRLGHGDFATGADDAMPRNAAAARELRPWRNRRRELRRAGASALASSP